MGASTELSASNKKVSSAITTFSTDYSKSQPTAKLQADLHALMSAIDGDKDLTAEKRATLSTDAHHLDTALTNHQQMSPAMQKMISDFSAFAGGSGPLVQVASVAPKSSGGNVHGAVTTSTNSGAAMGTSGSSAANDGVREYSNGTADLEVAPNSDGTATLSAKPGTDIKYNGPNTKGRNGQVRPVGFDINAKGKDTFIPMPKNMRLYHMSDNGKQFVIGPVGQNGSSVQKRNPWVVGAVAVALLAAGYKYLHSSGPTATSPFGQTGMPIPQDVAQGNMGDCWYLSALASVAETNPQLIQNNVHQNRDGTYNVTLYDTAHQPARPVSYNNIHIPSNWRGIGNPHGASALNPINHTPVQWVAAYELAALQFAQHPPTPGHNYNIRSDMEGGNPDAAYAMITGRTQSRTDVTRGSNQDRVWNDLVAANGPGSRPAGHNTPIEANANLNPGNGITALHTYSVVGALLVGGARMVVLHDPWGGPDAKRTISLAAFMSAFSAYFH